MNKPLDNNKQKDSITKQIIFTGVFSLYLISFINIYSYIPLFWSDQGLLPISELIHTNQTLFPSIAPILIKTNLISSESFVSLCCIIGALLSTISIFNTKLHNSIITSIILFCYLNIFLLGQDFMSFEWDYLLLEVGFITIFLNTGTSTGNLIISSYAVRVLQFVSLKYLLGTGLGLVHSKSRLVANYSWVETLLEKQFFPTIFAYYLFQYTSLVIKKLLDRMVIAIFVIVPFGQFLFFRRIRIFVGQVMFLYHFFMLFISNYGLTNIICIIANMVNFDDEFWETIIMGIGENIKNEQSNNSDKCNSNGNNALKCLRDKHLRGYEGNDSQWGLFQECLSFIIIALIFLNVICFLVFPNQQIASNSSLSIFNTFFSQQTLNYWMIFIIIYFIISSLLEISNNQPLKLSVSAWILFILITVFVLIYLVNSMNILYSGIGYAIATKYKGNYFYSFVDLSYNIFYKFHCVSSYNQFKDLYANDYNRKDLLITYLLDNETEWKEMEFFYRPKMNNTNHNLRWTPLIQPRLDWLFGLLTNDNNINNNVWLVSLLGRVFEKNTHLYKAIGAIIPQKKIDKIRIESYISGFTSNSTLMFKRDFQNLTNIERQDINQIIDQYHLPIIRNESLLSNEHDIDSGSFMINLLKNVPLFPCVITLGLIYLSLKQFIR